MLEARQCLVGFACVFVIFGCATTPPVQYHKITSGEWEAKILVEDHERAQSHVLRMDAFAVRDQRLRLDVTAALGTPVASLVMKGEFLEYVLPQKRAFFQGRASSDALRSVLALPLDPHLFYSIFFDVVPKDKRWLCETSQSGFLSSCRNADLGLSVKWSDREGGRKKISIRHQKASLQMKVLSFRPLTSKGSTVFSLVLPKSYKKLIGD